MIDLGRLRALHAVASYGTVLAASDALHCTPSAVSQQLAKLERETGATLVEKDGRRLRLTEARDERWIAARIGDVCHEWLIRVLPGVRPDFHVGEFETQLTLIAAGLGMAVIPRLARPPLPDGVRVVPLRPTPHRRVVVAWRETSGARPAIKAAVAALQDSWQRQATTSSAAGATATTGR